MSIAKLGLKDPTPCSVEDFSEGENYITHFYTPYDEFCFTAWVKVVQAEDDVVFHVQQSELNCSSVWVSENERKAMINGNQKNIEILGYIRMFSPDDILVHGGKVYEESEMKISVQSKDHCIKFCASNSARIYIDCILDIIELRVIKQGRKFSLQVCQGSDHIETVSLKTTSDSWLELGERLEGLNAYILEIDGLIKSIDIIANNKS